MASLQQTLIKWLRKTMIAAKDDPIVRLSLRHVRDGSKDKQVAQVDLDRESDPEEITRQVVQLAEDDVSGVGGLQQYVLFAFQKGQERSFARRPFKLRDESDDDDTSEALDGASDKNELVKQMSRHNEALTRIVVHGFGDVQRHYQRILESQNSRLENLESTHLRMLTLVEDLTTQRHIRQLADDESKYKRDMMDKTFEKISLYVPALVNRIGGKNLLPEKITPGEMAMKEIFETLSPAQLEGIAKELKPEQLVAFLTAFERYVKPKEDPKPDSGANGNGKAGN